MSKCIHSICVIVLSVMVSANSYARDVQLFWDANSEPDLAGYKIYYNGGSSPASSDGTSVVAGTAVVDVSNVTSTTLTGLDPGVSYYVGATAYSTDATESLFSNIVFVHEILPPTVSISSPTNNQVVSGVATITVNASDTSGIGSVELYVNGTILGTVSSAPYSFSWNTSLIPEQGYTLSAKAYDIYGNLAQSSDVAVTVIRDTSPPVVSITSPADNSIVRGNVALTVNATDNVAVSSVDYYVNDGLKYSTNVAPYTFTWNSESVSDGTYTIFARAHDTSSNTADSSLVHLTVDNLPPAVAITRFTTPTSLMAQIISGTASDSTGVASVTIRVGSGAPSAANVGNGAWTFQLSGLSLGSNTVTVTATDLAGNTATDTKSIVVDQTMPTLTAVLPQYTILDSVTVTGTISDNLPGSTISVQLGAGNPVSAVVNDNIWSCAVSGLSVGPNTVTVTSTDAAGNSSAPQTISTTRLRPGPMTSDTNPNVTVADAQKVLNFVLKLETPTAAQLVQSDVAALQASTLQPHPDGVLDLNDVSVMLRTAVGLTW